MSLDYLNWCRLCANSTDNTISIFDDHKNIDFSVKIREYLHIELIKVENDVRMCKYCYERIRDWDEYVSQVHKVQSMFSTFTNDIDNLMDKLTQLKNKDGNVLLNESLEIIIRTESAEIESKTKKIEKKKVKKKKEKRKMKKNFDEQFSDEDDIPLNNISFLTDLNCKNASSKNKIKLKIKPIRDTNECVEDLVQNDEYNEDEDDAPEDCDVVDEFDIDDEERGNSATFFFNWECHICKHLCCNWAGLSKHCKEEHNVGPRVECICGKQLQSRASIMKHKTKHTTGYGYKCDYENCGKRFHRQNLLDVHSVSHLPKELQPWLCCKCSRRFHTESLLKQHEKVHLPKEEKLIHPCDMCDKLFCSKSAVSSHLKAIHYKERPYVCDQCGHSFTSKGILQEHLTIHSDVFNYHCNDCNKSFKTKYRLKIHLDTHRETKYDCPICNLTLNTRRTLRMHLLVHKDEKAYQCSTCGKAFKRSKDLKNHYNLHTGRRPYICPFCMRTFANGSNCRSHKRRMHPEELKVYEAALASGQDPIIFHYEDEETTGKQLDHHHQQQNHHPEDCVTPADGGVLVCSGVKEEDVEHQLHGVSPLNLQSRYKTDLVQTITLSTAAAATGDLAQLAIAGQAQAFQYPIHNLYTFQPSAIPAFPGNPYFRQ